MLILALDTTTPAASAALADGARLLELAAIDPAQPIATRLPGDLMALLARHGVDLARIELFAVATGPGSFTGLRIGIATMQGLALAKGKPLVGVSAFDALAASVPAGRDYGDRESRLATWIDAWRGEVYGATYAIDGGAPRMTDDPVVATPQELLDRGPAAVFIGDAAVKYRHLLGGRDVVSPTPPLGAAVARLAHARAIGGELPPPHAIRPLYVRRPDAELARDRRR